MQANNIPMTAEGLFEKWVHQDTKLLHNAPDIEAEEKMFLTDLRTLINQEVEKSVGENCDISPCAGMKQLQYEFDKVIEAVGLNNSTKEFTIEDIVKKIKDGQKSRLEVLEEMEKAIVNSKSHYNSTSSLEFAFNNGWNGKQAQVLEVLTALKNRKGE